jgi:hypothetical protein
MPSKCFWEPCRFGLRILTGKSRFWPHFLSFLKKEKSLDKWVSLLSMRRIRVSEADYSHCKERSLKTFLAAMELRWGKHEAGEGQEALVWAAGEEYELPLPPESPAGSWSEQSWRCLKSKELGLSVCPHLTSPHRARCLEWGGQEGSCAAVCLFKEWYSINTVTNKTKICLFIGARDWTSDSFHWVTLATKK